MHTKDEIQDVNIINVEDSYILEDSYTLEDIEPFHPPMEEPPIKPDTRFFKLNSSGKPTFSHVSLGKHLWKEISIIWFGNELYYYNKGVYIKGGYEKLSFEVQNILGEESNKARKNEVLDWITTEARQQSFDVNGDNNIINLQNGLYNLKTGEFKNHTPQHYSTIQIPIDYNPDAQCPEIKKFLKSIVPADSIRFVLEWFGYSMLRDYKISKALMLFGTGGNGKSIFISLYNRFLGLENISAVDLHSLEENRFAPSRLFGKLANTFADIDSAYLETSRMIKSLTGNDVVIAEFKNKDLFEFRNFAKLTFSANRLPSFKDTSEGNFDRWIILPFPNRFRDSDKQDLNLIDKITTPEELSGLLNLALEHLSKLLARSKFTIGSSMQAEIDKWKDQTDSVIMFINDVCEKNPDVEVLKKTLYTDYKYWCTEGGFKPLKVTNFYERMQHHGYTPKQSSKSNNLRKWVFKGIHLPRDNNY